MHLESHSCYKGSDDAKQNGVFCIHLKHAYIEIQWKTVIWNGKTCSVRTAP